MCAALILAFVECPPSAAADRPQEAVAEVISLVDAGRFADAEARIATRLAATNLDADERAALEFERERMRRMRLDFSLTADDVQARLRREVPDLRGEEFATWDRAGLLESLAIDGDRRYFNRAPSNLFRLSEQARARRKVQTPFNDGPLEKPHPHHREIREQALATGKSSVAPRRVRVTYSISVDADVVPAGEKLSAWLPYPREIPGQHEKLVLLESVPKQHAIAPRATMQRTVYLEQAAQAGAPTKFSITYELTTYAIDHALDPQKVAAAKISAQRAQELAGHMGERPPHIVFSDDIRRFSRAVVGDEKNPYRIAQKLFLAVDRIPWAGAREYSTIPNISEYALHAGHADCGQQTLLLMTLLRLNGIPARWQSGWVFSDGDYDNMHDWGWLYLEPYSWVPMDVTFGRLPFGDPALDDFYLGGLDAYRLVFNDDYSRDFAPPKRHVRSETVDSQRGEVEWRGGNLYFDRWDYEFKAQVLR